MSRLAEEFNMFEISLVQDKHDPSQAKGSYNAGGRADDIAEMLGAFLSQNGDPLLRSIVKKALVHAEFYDGNIDDEELEELLDAVETDFRAVLPNIN